MTQSETQLPLMEYRTALANSAGVATIDITLAYPNERWEVRSTVIATRAVGASPGSASAEFKLYRDLIANSGLIDATTSGANNTTDTPYTVHSGNHIFAVWTGMTSGDEATIRLDGTRYLRGKR